MKNETRQQYLIDKVESGIISLLLNEFIPEEVKLKILDEIRVELEIIKNATLKGAKS